MIDDRIRRVVELESSSQAAPDLPSGRIRAYRGVILDDDSSTMLSHWYNENVQAENDARRIAAAINARPMGRGLFQINPRYVPMDDRARQEAIIKHGKLPPRRTGLWSLLCRAGLHRTGHQLTAVLVYRSCCHTLDVREPMTL